MRYLILVLTLLIIGCSSSTVAKERTVPKVIKVYERGKPLLPKYIIKNNKVYEPGNIIPKYVIRNGKVYKAGKPVIPLYKLKEIK